MSAQSHENEPDLERLSQAHGLLQTDPARGLRELRALADSGSASSMLYLGWAYQRGTGTNADATQAEAWYRRASEKGSKQALYYLGHLYLGQKEYAKALEVFTAGAAMNYMPAIYCLGEMYREGTGVEKNPEKARSLFERAAAMGHIFAKRSLAKQFMSGQFGFFNFFKGCALLFDAIKDGIVVASKDSSSERLLA